MITHNIEANGINIHVSELGAGEAVLFCHGFPLIGTSWRAQMETVAAAGFRAIAPDLRGFGKSGAPGGSCNYSPLHHVGDMIAVLDHLQIDTCTVVGQDAGGDVAWTLALLRPDRVKAVFGIYPSVAGMSLPFLEPGEPLVFDQFRAAGLTDFYMFRQTRSGSEKNWNEAPTPIESALYWTSGQPVAAQRWDPFDVSKDMLRPVPEPNTWMNPQILKEVTEAYKRTGFSGGMNYYRAWEPYFRVAGPIFAGQRLQQPAFLLSGLHDGLNAGKRPNEEETRYFLPNLRGFLVLDDAGHWPQLEKPDIVNSALLSFLEGLES